MDLREKFQQTTLLRGARIQKVIKKSITEGGH